MKIKIIKKSNPKDDTPAWYNDYIGQVFNVKEIPDFNKQSVIVKTPSGHQGLVDGGDFEIIK